MSAGSPPLASSATAPSARTALAGVLTLVSLIAFEAMAIGTAMPVIAADLGGLRRYGLAFSLFLTTSLFGMVAAGSWNDVRGPRQPAVVGLVLFAAGLLVCGLAPTFAVLLVGRVVAGVGGGLLVVTMYVVIGLVWDAAARPRVFAWLSSAWVVPSLVGPALAGWLAEDVSWRLVFLLVVPVVLVAAALLAAPLRAMTGPGAADGAPSPAPGRLLAGGVLAAGAVLVQWGLTSLLPVAPVPLGALVVGVALVAWSLPRLLPAGTLRAARGLPSVIGARGLYSASFAGAEAYLPLVLVTAVGLGVRDAGLALTAGALGWALGSYLQGREGMAVPRHRLMAGAGAVVGAAVATLALPALSLAPAWTAVLAWAVAGAAMGVGMASTSVLLLAMSPEAARGRNSSALQLADALGAVLGIALGGAVLAAGTGAQGPDGGSGPAFAVVFGGLALAGLAAGVVGARTRARARAPRGLGAERPGARGDVERGDVGHPGIGHPDVEPPGAGHPQSPARQAHLA